MPYYELLTRPVPDPDRTLRYGPHPDQIIDIHEGSGGPLVILLHGGFWRAQHDRTHTRPMAAALAAEGYTVCVPEYRRVGHDGGGYPGTFDDVATAIDTLIATSGGEAPVLVGHSAGGHLALWYALRHRLPATSPWHAHPEIGGVVSLAGISDVTGAYTTHLGNSAAHNLLHNRPDHLNEVDPSRLLPYGDRPLILVHGSKDRVVPVEMSRHFAALTGTAELRELPDTGHFKLIDPLSRAWPTVLEAIASISRRPLLSMEPTSASPQK
ncbi:MAG TPA: alpha/beta hydrolase [Nonomuraea sp.]|nr:alpha/beta hydrolase [Nonomuraea sp.]